MSDFDPSDLQAQGGAPDTAQEGGPAWEFRAELGLGTAAIRTIRDVLFNPTETFAHARVTGGLATPLAFAFYVGLPLMILNTLISSALQPISMRWLIQQLDIPQEQVDQVFQSGVHFQLRSLIATLIALPFLIVAGAFLTAAMTHVSLLMVGGAERTFEATYRAVTYSYVTCYPLVLVPCCGPFLALAWFSVVAIIALVQMHETDTWRVILGLTLGSLVLGCCISAPIIAMAYMALGGAEP